VTVAGAERATLLLSLRQPLRPTPPPGERDGCKCWRLQKARLLGLQVNDATFAETTVIDHPSPKTPTELPETDAPNALSRAIFALATLVERVNCADAIRAFGIRLSFAPVPGR